MAFPDTPEISAAENSSEISMEEYDAGSKHLLTSSKLDWEGTLRVRIKQYGSGSIADLVESLGYKGLVWPKHLALIEFPTRYQMYYRAFDGPAKLRLSLLPDERLKTIVHLDSGGTLNVPNHTGYEPGFEAYLLPDPEHPDILID